MFAHYCFGKKGLIFIDIFFSEYHDPFQFIHTMPSSVPCFAMSQLYCPPQQYLPFGLAAWHLLYHHPPPSSFAHCFWGSVVNLKRNVLGVIRNRTTGGKFNVLQDPQKGVKPSQMQCSLPRALCVTDQRPSLFCSKKGRHGIQMTNSFRDCTDYFLWE